MSEETTVALDPGELRRHAAGERQAVDPERITRRQQDVVEARALGREHDVTTVRVRRSKLRIGDAEKLVVVVAQRREPS